MVQIVEIPLPKNWPRYIKSSILQTISLASTVFTSVCGWAAKVAYRPQIAFSGFRLYRLQYNFPKDFPEDQRRFSHPPLEDFLNRSDALLDPFRRRGLEKPFLRCSESCEIDGELIDPTLCCYQSFPDSLADSALCNVSDKIVYTMLLRISTMSNGT